MVANSRYIKPGEVEQRGAGAAQKLTGRADDQAHGREPRRKPRLAPTAGREDDLAHLRREPPRKPRLATTETVIPTAPTLRSVRDRCAPRLTTYRACTSATVGIAVPHSSSRRAESTSKGRPYGDAPAYCGWSTTRAKRDELCCDEKTGRASARPRRRRGPEWSDSAKRRTGLKAIPPQPIPPDPPPWINACPCSTGGATGADRGRL